MDFHRHMKVPVTEQFDKMKRSGGLFCTAVDRDSLWEMYITSYPEGSNPIFRTKTEHDCTCCRHFVKMMGNVVSIKDGKLVSIWDGQFDDPNYRAVAQEMSKFVKSFKVSQPFMHYEKVVGTPENRELGDAGVITWNHFSVELPVGSNHGLEVVVKKDDIAKKLGHLRTTHQMCIRGMSEIDNESVETVLDLMASKTLYRGDEFVHIVKDYKKLRTAFFKKATKDRENFVWSVLTEYPENVLRIRGVSIGQLLKNLTEGMELEKAVDAFGKMMDPNNYKRSTALVTPGMIAKAKEKVEGLGLADSLQRKFARLSDVDVTDVIWADHSAKKVMGDSVFDSLPTKATKSRSLDKVEEIPIENFIRDVVPRAESIEIMFENKHQTNLVSLIAPKYGSSKPLFKWDNGFSWSYNGEVADSMRQKVQERGGRVDGVLRFTHMWNHLGRNASLMDLHVFMPGTTHHNDGSHDGYPRGRRVGWNHRGDTLSGGTQDVDYVTAAPEGYVPVENITFPKLDKMPEGLYTFKVHNWSFRPPTDSGFSAEIEFDGNVYEFEHAMPLKQKQWVTVAKLELRKGQFSVVEMMENKQTSKEHWGIKTQDFHRVSTIMLSPNYWATQGNQASAGVGNKHWMFMIDGCRNEGNARGFYNEFLRPELDEHRKVLEMVGARTLVEDSPDQLSGLGFSSTGGGDFLARVKGSFTRTVKVVV